MIKNNNNICFCLSLFFHFEWMKTWFYSQILIIYFGFLGLLDPIIEKEEKKEQTIERNYQQNNKEEEEEEEEVGEIYNLNIIQEEGGGELVQRVEKKKKKKKRVQFFPNLGTEETIHENSKRKQNKYQIFSHDTNNNESSNQSIISQSSNKIIHLSDQFLKRTSSFKLKRWKWK